MASSTQFMAEPAAFAEGPKERLVRLLLTAARLVMLIGILIGTLSSIFFAAQLLLWFKVSKRDLMPKARDLSELERRP